MYQEFFSLKELPFSIAPDPEFLFLSVRHKEALAHLSYGLHSDGGFVLLTGEVGTGKTTVCRALLQELPEEVDIAFILNPALTEVELLAAICDQFKIEYPRENISLKLLFDLLASWMMDNYAQGRRAVVLIDEAQHLRFAVLEQLRLLTNIDSNNKKALQVILIGQTELQDKLKQTELRQLAQRITTRYHLLPLSEKESEYYIQHRLNIAGAVYPVFVPMVQKKIFKYSQGIPRVINLICDRCLLCAYSENTAKVTPKILKLVLKELDHSNQVNLSLPLRQWLRLSLLTVLILLTVLQLPKILDFPLITLFFDKSPFITRALGGESEPQVDSAVTLVSDAVRQKQAAGQAIAQQSQEDSLWFDDYPQLELTEKEFAHALKALYAIWGYRVALADTSCKRGAAVSLLCFSERSNLYKLKRLNYPAVIKLVNGNQYLYVVVYRLVDDYQLIIGEQSISVSDSWLERYWQGGYTSLWKTPFSSTKQLMLGEKGKRVLWLSQQLDKIYSRPPSNKRRFDLSLLRQVKQFQRDNALTVDGIVGVRTLMAIVQQSNPEFPRLIAEKL
jgi:general secretion pathway protein A